MGWKQRDWFFGCDARKLFDTRGNIGPTLWWNGQIVGGWTSAPDGEIRIELLTDYGAAAASAVARAALELQTRLHGSVVTTSLTIPLQRELLSRAGP